MPPLFSFVDGRSASVDRDRHQIVLEGAGKRAVALRPTSRIGWPLAANSAHSFVPGAISRKAGELALQFVARHFAQIGDGAFAEMGEFGLVTVMFRFSSGHFSLLVRGTSLRTNPLQSFRFR